MVKLKSQTQHMRYYGNLNATDTAIRQQLITSR